MSYEDPFRRRTGADLTPDDMARISSRTTNTYEFSDDDWTPPATSEEWGRMSREAFMRQRGVEPPTDRATQIERVLLDLLADLRAHCREPSCHCDIGRSADHAEARLRLVRDD